MPAKQFSGDLEEFFRRLFVAPMDGVLKLVEVERYEEAIIVARSGEQVFGLLRQWVDIQDSSYEEVLRLAKRGTESFVRVQKWIKLLQIKKGRYEERGEMVRLRKRRQILKQWKVKNKGKLPS